MNPSKTPFYKKMLLMALLVQPFGVFAKSNQKSNQKSKKLSLPTEIVPAATGILSFKPDSRFNYSNDVPQASAVFLAIPTDDSISWAEEFSSFLMSEKVINFMEEKYTASESYFMSGQVRNFVYLYGFDVTSQDLRGSALYGIDQRQELALRENMTRSLRGYMLGKGVMEYLKTIKGAEKFVNTAEQIQKASQIDFEIKSEPVKPGQAPVAPWKFKTGPDLGSQTVFFKATKGDWNFELRENFTLGALTASTGYSYYRSHFSTRFFNTSKVLTNGYSYNFAKRWWARYSVDFPVNANTIENQMFQSVGLRHLF